MTIENSYNLTFLERVTPTETNYTVFHSTNTLVQDSITNQYSIAPSLARVALLEESQPLYANYFGGSSMVYHPHSKTNIVGYHYIKDVQDASTYDTDFILRPIFMPKPPAHYASLRPRLDGAYYKAPGNYFTFEYDGEYQAGDLQIKVYDWKRTQVLNTSSFIRHGHNKVTFTLQPPSGQLYNQFIPGAYYTVEVTNEKGETRYLRFQKQ